MQDTNRPVGVFRAVATRDGNALDRDGQPFFRLNHVFDDLRDGPFYEIQFGDGVWILAATPDLDVDSSSDVGRFLVRRYGSAERPRHLRA